MQISLIKSIKNMKKVFLIILSSVLISLTIKAQELDSNQLWINEVEQSLLYQTGVIKLDSGNASLTVPKGFQFLDKDQTMYVLTELWGNPADSTILGMLVKAGGGVLGDNSWAYTISYDQMGYVEDDDAEDINYDDLLKEQQGEYEAENPARLEQGFPTIQFIGWASQPFYDKDKKILHWAKELKFGEDTLNTLNYNLRVLGRKGIFMLNAVATMNQLPEVRSSLNDVINSVTFDNGSKYADFDPDVDEVAAWTIGGLVAGKILAKIGFFAVLVKFWKLIALGVVAAAGGIWKLITGRKKEGEQDTRINKHQE